MQIQTPFSVRKLHLMHLRRHSSHSSQISHPTHVQGLLLMEHFFTTFAQETTLSLFTLMDVTAQPMERVHWFTAPAVSHAQVVVLVDNAQSAAAHQVDTSASMMDAATSSVATTRITQ
jgi:hypothetical protein